MYPKLLSAASFVIATVFVAALPARAQDDLALARTVAEANNAFGVALYREFAKEQKGNLVFSPFSLSSALALTATGARGQTEKELWHALRLNLPREQVAAGYAGVGRIFDDAAASGSVALTVANGLWLQQGYALEPAFLDVARGGFLAEVTPLDFAQPEMAAEQINDWVRDETRLLIPRMIGAANLPPTTRLTLTNAAYFKARWHEKFGVGATRPAPFLLLDSTSIDVPMMRRTVNCAVVETANVRLLRLPYQGRRLEMVVVLPSLEDGLPEVERTFDRGLLNEWMAALDLAQARSVALELPRFKIAASPDAAGGLEQLGVIEAFSSAGADFSGMTKERGFAVGTVIHRAVIDVNEEGTEAAAATAVRTFGAAAPPKDPIPFKVDHPFLFLIRETRTGAILFLGRIVDPRAE